MSALSCEEVSVAIDGADILREVTFAVQSGSWVAVLGPNGAGKSTLLHAISGVVPHSGRVRIDGDELASLDRRDRAARVALVAQSPIVPTGMRVVDYVLLGRTPHRAPFAPETADDLRVVEQVLTDLDLLVFARRRLTSLSGGERQRAFLARALAQQSRVVLLDEPTSALDIGHQVDVLSLIDSLRRDLGLTIVSTLHDLTLAGRYPDTVVLLAGGRVVATGPPADVLTAERIETHYGTPVRILHDDDGLVVVPTTRRGRP